MHSELMDPNSVLKAVYSTSTDVSIALGGTSTSVGDLDFVGASVDRLMFARRYRSALIVVAADLTLASSAIVTVNVGMQDAAASSGAWSNLPGTTSTGRRATIIGTAASSDSAPAGAVFQAGVSLVGARRYIRPVMQVTTLSGATSSGQIVLAKSPIFVMAGADENPVDTFATLLSSQAGT